MTLAALRRDIKALANPEMAAVALRFFKTGRGEYGEGDRFLGIRVPALRRVAATHRDLSLRDLDRLLDSRWHEERGVALMILVWQYARGDEAHRDAIFDLYLHRTDAINNWDLVDLSAPGIVGAHLRDRDRSMLAKLARSESLWERRIAIVATYDFIRRGEFGDTLRIATMLLGDRHDLIHKATGWMLREVGKRDRHALAAFLKTDAPRMPRTMLRYAIERFPEPLRQRYLRA